VHGARNEFVAIEHLTDHEIEAIRSALELEVGEDEGEHRTQATISHLLKRR
jgi:low affinity Fe/Cu permease